jgi:hypothetical protein
MLDAYETTIGTAPKLQLRSGAPPTNITDADSGTLLAEITCPSDWMSAASNGSKAQAGSWTTTGLAGAGAGTNIGHYRLKDSSGTTTHDQGTVTVTGGGGDLTVDNVSVAQNQNVSITSWTKTAPHG